MHWHNCPSAGGCVAAEAVLVGDGQPTLGGLAKVGADFIECPALDMAAPKRGNRSRKTAGVWFRAENRRENQKMILESFHVEIEDKTSDHDGEWPEGKL